MDTTETTSLDSLQTSFGCHRIKTTSMATTFMTRLQCQLAQVQLASIDFTVIQMSCNCPIKTALSCSVLRNSAPTIGRPKEENRFKKEILRLVRGLIFTKCSQGQRYSTSMEQGTKLFRTMEASLLVLHSQEQHCCQIFVLHIYDHSNFINDLIYFDYNEILQCCEGAQKTTYLIAKAFGYMGNQVKYFLIVS